MDKKKFEFFLKDNSAKVIGWSKNRWVVQRDPIIINLDGFVDCLADSDSENEIGGMTLFSQTKFVC